MNLENLSNNELADAFLAHFWANYDKHLERLDYLRRDMKLQDTERLEDVFQETVAKCAEKIRRDGFGKEQDNQYDPVRGHYTEKKKAYYFGAYFGTALYFNLIQYDKSLKRRDKVKRGYNAENPFSVEPEDFELDGVPTEQQRQLQWLEEAVLLLKETNRTIYNLQRSGLTYKRIGRLLKLTPDAVKMRLSTAKKQINTYCLQKHHAYLNPPGQEK